MLFRSRYRIVVKDLREPYGLPWELINNFENEYSFVGNDGEVLFFQTNLNAPNRRIIAINLRKPQKEHWKELIPQSENALESTRIVGNMFVCSYLKDARTQVRLHAMDGTFVREVQFPGIGSAAGFDGRRGDTETFYSFSSFALPPTTYRYNMITGESQEFRRSAVKFNPDDYETSQVFYTSRDGTRIPMFLCHRKGLQKDGTNPVLLYGYGGFNISITPSFSVSRITWMEMGGVLAVANLRGGVALFTENGWPKRALHRVIRTGRIFALHPHAFNPMRMPARKKTGPRRHAPRAKITRMKPDTLRGKLINVEIGRAHV